MPDKRCRHCGAHIRLHNFMGGPRWMHQPPDSAFQDDMHRHCHLTVAEPQEDRT